jgi:hypothetical protein
MLPADDLQKIIERQVEMSRDVLEEADHATLSELMDMDALPGSVPWWLALFNAAHCELYDNGLVATPPHPDDLAMWRTG